IDSDCQLPPDLAKAMNDEGLFRLYVPKVLGGPELDPITAYHVVEDISRADGSAGWCSFNGTALTAAVSRISVKAAKELFGDPPDVGGSGSARSGGTARVTEGGYVVSGRWNYLSGVDHAKCLFLNCDVVDDNGPILGANGGPTYRVAVLPLEAGEMIVTWNTMGMRGTASNDAEFSDVFVPESHTYSRTEPGFHDNPLYNPQTAILCSWTLASANALGMARGAMDAFLNLATAGSTNSPSRLCDRATVQTIVGECEAIIGAGRAYVLSAVGEMWNAMVSKDSDIMDKAVHVRLAITHGIRQSVQVVEKLFYSAGTGAIHESNGLERFFRDLHVSGQHISGLHSNYEFGGQSLLGAEITAATYS
ncbi:MAG: acyl-CoA dehydrogenase family protein, partial [Chloroflexota bacterium]|nr:acyl-CoA dehydrogenase family protein [Chloroflexota bacterium]